MGYEVILPRPEELKFPRDEEIMKYASERGWLYISIGFGILDYGKVFLDPSPDNYFTFKPWNFAVRPKGRIKDRTAEEVKKAIREAWRLHLEKLQNGFWEPGDGWYKF